MNNHSAKKLMRLLASVIFLLACAVPVLPLPAASSPTADPGLIQTIVVATAGAAQTQTALVVPSPADTSTATLLPTLIPTDTPTATETVIFIIPTKTSTPTNTPPPTATGSIQETGSSCKLLGQSPANDTVFGSREKFTAKWTIMNTGSETWSADNYDFYFSSGRDMHETDLLDLPRNVRAGAQITLQVDMRTPGNAGTYTSTWTLGSSRNPLCVVSVRVIVR